MRRIAMLAVTASIVAPVGVQPALAAALALTPTSTSPSSDAIVQPPGSVTATFATALNTVQGLSTIQLTEAGTAVSGTESFTDNDHTIVFTPAHRLADGVYTATVTATDTSLPPQSGTSSWTFTVDGTPPPVPTVDPMAVVNAASESAVTITGSEAETTAALALKVYGYYGGPVLTPTPSRNGTTWTTTVDLSSAADGPIEVQVSASDAAGNTSYGNGGGTKDATPPARAATTPADGATVGAVRTVQITWNEHVDPSSVAISVRSGDGTVIPGTVSTDQYGWSSSLTLQSLPDAAGDPWTVSAGATDLAGNTDPSPSVTTFNVQSPGVGTDVCGGLPIGVTTWSAAGTPYRICTGGLTVTSGSELDVDGSQGPFAVTAEGSGGLSIDTGIVRTVNTDAADRISFDSATGSPWAGLSATYNAGHAYGPTNNMHALDLAYVDVAHATTAIRAYESDPVGNAPVVTLDDIAVSDTTSDGIVDDGADFTVTSSSVARAGGDGIHAECTYGGLRAPLDVDHDQVTAAVAIGIDARSCADPQVTNNVVTDSGTNSHEPAMVVTSKGYPQYPFGEHGMQLGTPSGVSGNTGGGNGIDAIAVFGDEKGGFTWITPSADPSVHALGYVNLGLVVEGSGTVVMPANSVVKTGAVPAFTPTGSLPDIAGRFLVEGPQLTSEAGTVFTSLSDDSVGPPTCASVLANSCRPNNDSWPGLDILTGAQLNGTTIEHAKIGVHSGIRLIGPGAPITGAGDTVSDCQVGFMTADLSLSSTTVRDIVSGSQWGPGGAIWTIGSLSLHDVTVSNVDGTAVDAQPTGRRSASDPASALDIEGLTVDHAGNSGLLLEGNITQPLTVYDDPVVTGLTVTHSFIGGYVNATDMSVGPGRHIDNLNGASNTTDDISLAGTFVDGLTWVTPTNRDTVHALGYTGSFTMLGGQLTLPNGSTVTADRIALEGATLDATGGNIHVTSAVLLADDGTDGTPPQVLLQGVTWDGLAGTSNSPGPMEPGIGVTAADATVTITGSTLIGPGAANNSTYPGELGADFAGPVTLDNDEFVGLGLQVHGGELVDSAVGNAARGGLVNVVGPAPFTMTGDVFQSADLAAIVVDGGVLDMRRTRVVGGRNAYAGSTAGRAVVIARNQAAITGDCNAIIDNDAGLSTDSSSTASSTDSDLAGNTGYDAYAGGGAIGAQRVWWGQAGGPTGSQAQGVPMDASDPVAAQRPQAVVATSSDATQPDGGYGTGTMTVTVDMSRRMDTTIQPTVTMTGPDGSAHSIAGDWTSATEWVGHYDVSPSTASGGSNRIDVSGARGCVNDPATNLMQPASAAVTIDEPPATTITGGPSDGSYSRSNPAFAFTSGAGGVTFACRIDSGSWTRCASPTAYVNLPDGRHTFSVQGTDASGTGSATSRSWTVDGHAPTLRVAAPAPRYVLAQIASVAFTATDTGAGVANYDVRLATGTWHTQLSAWQLPQAWQHTAATNVNVGITAGQIRCFSIRARDRVGNTSPWSPHYCVVRPLDDRSLPILASGWVRALNSRDYLGTVTRATRAGSALSLGNAVARRIALIVTTCRTCGRVTVSIAGHVVATASLYSSTVRYRQVVQLPVFSLRAGRIVVQNVSGSCEIDGIAVATI